MYVLVEREDFTLLGGLGCVGFCVVGSGSGVWGLLGFYS